MGADVGASDALAEHSLYFSLRFKFIYIYIYNIERNIDIFIVTAEYNVLTKDLRIMLPCSSALCPYNARLRVVCVY